MKWAPVASTPHAAVLPVFDPTWKDKCLACDKLVAHHNAKGTKNEHTMLHCAATIPEGGRTLFHKSACIDARDDDGPCGPGALLFVPKVVR